MTDLQFSAMPSEIARALWQGGTDAYGNQPDRTVSDGVGVPCRHCLRPVEKGAAYLILAYRPFPEKQAYAETGPIFLHGSPCSRYEKVGEMPAMFWKGSQFLLRAYNAENRIIYGTGAVVAVGDLEATARQLLANPDAAYLHLRSSQYNCFLCRIESSNSADFRS